MSTSTENTQALKSEVWHLYQSFAAVDAAQDMDVEDWPLLRDMLAEDAEGVEDQAVETIGKLVQYARELDARDAAIKAEVSRLNELKSRNASRKAWAKRAIRSVLGHLGQRKVETPTALVYLQRGRESVEVEVDATLLPSEWRQVEYKANKKAILAALKAGKEVGGARLVRGEESVVIK